jgi:hypothetical protein
MKDYAAPILLTLLCLGLFFTLYFTNEKKETIVVTPLKDYEYSFDVDGTDSILLYTIYDFQHNVIAKDITANKLDSVINNDNE